VQDVLRRLRRVSRWESEIVPARAFALTTCRDAGLVREERAREFAKGCRNVWFTSLRSLAPLTGWMSRSVLEDFHRNTSPQAVSALRTAGANPLRATQTMELPQRSRGFGVDTGRRDSCE